MNLFEDFGLSHELLTAIKKLGFAKPTHIQEASIPHIMASKDVIGESATGSGKTLAFGCGIVDKVIPGKGLQALVIVPTRELAEQVKQSLKQLSYHKPLKIIAVYGGVSIGPQIHGLPEADVVVSTPGRLLDHLERRTINVSKINLLVLDEADRMFDMGFIDDIRQIIKVCPAKRQTLLFSATISSHIKDLASAYMTKPTEVHTTKHVDPSKLKQAYYNIEKNMKLSLLAHLLRHEKSGLVMVFCNSRKTTDFVVKNLRANRINAIAIHGGFSQNKRTKAMEMFNKAEVAVLVCTDVAARGLHIENVSHVYNYEVPRDPKDYVHRIGRTARAGEEGKVINLLCEYDHDNFSNVLREYPSFSIEKVQRPYVERIISIRSEDSGQSSGRRPWRQSPRSGGSFHRRNRSSFRSR